MKAIPLTQGRVAIVDDRDYTSLIIYKWHAAKRRRIWYAIRNLPRSEGAGVVLMHRQIMQASPETEIDHKDGDGLNNRRMNLRVATHRNNTRNRNMRKSGTTSRFKGVSWAKNEKQWRATIRSGPVDSEGRSKQRSLGYFHDEEKAARAYDQAALEAFGEFAALNYPAEDS